jgi:hypothetical protein
MIFEKAIRSIILSHNMRCILCNIILAFSWFTASFECALYAKSL